jgi:DNA-binding beta-propeller fold protein YncE
MKSSFRPTGRPFAVVAAAGVAALAVPALAEDFLYFAEITPGITDGWVSKVRTDGVNLQRLVQVGGGLRSVALDPVDRKVYWTDVNNFVIARADLDGSNIENIVTSGLIFPAAIAIDPVNRDMFWLDQDNWLAHSNLDGTGYNIVNETVTHRGIAIDHDAGKIYWSTSDTMFKGKIFRSNFDGSGPQIVVTSQMPEFKPNTIALDLAGGKIYWTDYVIDAISRANLDGSNAEILWVVGANHNPRGLTLDLNNGKMYWGQDNDFDATSGRIMRANLDGTSPEIVINDIGLPNYLEFVSEGGCSADFNGDQQVDFFDYLDFAQAFAADEPSADFNGDHQVDFFDYLDFADAFSAGC